MLGLLSNIILVRYKHEFFTHAIHVVLWIVAAKLKPLQWWHVHAVIPGQYLQMVQIMC